MSLLKGSGVLKLAAFVVAVMSYIYIHNEITNTEKKNTADASYKLIKLTAKTLPVKVRLETVPPDGYRIVEDKVAVMPAQVTVIGPEVLLENAQNAETAIVDVSENTKTINKRIPLESVAGIPLTGEPTNVDIIVPIEKLPEPEAPAAAPATAPAPPAAA